MSAASAFDPATDTLLMDAAEMTVSEAFTRERIQPRIMQDWLANDSLLLTDWVMLSERYRPPLAVADEWSALHAQEIERVAETADGLREAALRRILKSIGDYEKNYPIWEAYKASKQHFLRPSRGGDNKGHRIRHTHVPAPEELKCTSFLPARFATDIVSAMCLSCLFTHGAVFYVV